LPNGPQKTAALNALVSKHEGGREFEPVHEGAPDYQACHVVEITPETMTGKTDLAQNKDQDGRRREIAQHLARRGMDGDLKAVAAMGYELDYDQLHGWRVK
jgi:predicted FMN-binding regulatory protein PaiB